MVFVLGLDPEVQSCRGSLKLDRVICAAYRRHLRMTPCFLTVMAWWKVYSGRLVCQPHEKYANKDNVDIGKLSGSLSYTLPA